MKRSKLKRQSKESISRLQRKLWSLIKQIIRKKYPPVCYTCGALNLSGSNLQTGHLWAKASLGAYLKYDLRVLRIQCARCNLFLGGMGAVFYSKILKELGTKRMEELEKDRQKIVRAYDHYVKLLSEYQLILDSLK